jgi:hypothetical protein
MLLNEVPNVIEAMTSMLASRRSSIALNAFSSEPSLPDRSLSEERDHNLSISVMLVAILGIMRARYGALMEGPSLHGSRSHRQILVERGYLPAFVMFENVVGGH